MRIGRIAAIAAVGAVAVAATRKLNRSRPSTAPPSTPDRADAWAPPPASADGVDSGDDTEPILRSAPDSA